MAESPVFDEITGFGGYGVPGTYTAPPTPLPSFPSGGFPGFPVPTGTVTATSTSSGTAAPIPTFPGFPGGGGAASGCVGTGPFNSTVVNLGPGTLVGAHCLVRGVSGEAMKASLASGNVEIALGQTTFETFRTTLENGGRGSVGAGVHGGGHGVVGGEMVNIASSPAGA